MNLPHHQSKLLMIEEMTDGGREKVKFVNGTLPKLENAHQENVKEKGSVFVGKEKRSGLKGEVVAKVHEEKVLRNKKKLLLNYWMIYLEKPKQHLQYIGYHSHQNRLQKRSNNVGKK